MVEKHGDYRLSDGSRATVVHVSRHAAFGFDSHGNARAWRQSNGKAIRMYAHDCTGFDIVGPWTIEKPFTISEHGCGVYETRDGCELSVVAPFGSGWRLAGFHSGFQRYDNGRAYAGNEHCKDLVRYLRPLDDEWKPTCELRWCKSADANIGSVEYVKTDIGRWNFADLEQKWVCDDKFEWRPVEVQQ